MAHLVTAPMPGVVKTINCSIGDDVSIYLDVLLYSGKVSNVMHGRNFIKLLTFLLIFIL